MRLIQRVEVWAGSMSAARIQLAKARMAVNRTRELDLDGFVVDAEIEYKEKGRAVAARRYMEAVRSGLGDMQIALSTFRFPRLHHELPFEEFLNYCDFSMPQVYHEKASNVEEQLEKSVEQYLNLKPARPVFLPLRHILIVVGSLLLKKLYGFWTGQSQWGLRV